VQLITGGMGFIGLHTARAFLDAGENVVVSRYRTRRQPSFLEGEWDKRLFAEALDLSHERAVIGLVEKHGVTGIIHLAVPALATLSAAEEFDVNMNGLKNILEAARIGSVKRVAIASSVAVYAGLKEGPFTEDMLLPVASGNPTEAYKKSIEILASHYADRTGMEIIFLRVGGIYGPLYHSLSNLPARLVHAAVQGVPGPLPPKRRPDPHADDPTDACFVKDCAAAIQLLQSAPSLKHRIYNVSAGLTAVSGDFVGALKARLPDAEAELKPGRGPRGREHARMDISRLVAETGFKAAYDAKAGIADYVDWLEAGNEY
jgi:UDP-glucose 4-epimerase